MTHSHTYRTITSFALLVPLAAWLAPLQGQRDTPKDIDPDPEIERRSFQLAEGLEANLFAADPLLAKPIQMNFDAAGRLWIASSQTYPQIKPGQPADDKIIVLEDRAGTGKADRTTVFASGLLIPTGIEPGDGGVYVANSTELVHYRDTNGDGKADRKRIVLSGFGTEDTHHMLHTLRWGPEGLLYFNQSIYIHSHLETPHGVRRLNGGGIWHLRPETLELDVFMYGLVNPWGHHFDRWGQSFATDGAGGEGVNYVIPRGYYVTTPYPRKIFPGLNPGQPKFCAHEIVGGRHLPESWQGDLVTNDFRGHRVCRFKLVPDGAGYAAIQQADVIRSNHPAFRPIDVKMGPDGALYIADWFNPIIQHGEVDFRDPRRDQTRGRIWRITAKGRPLVPRPKLVEAKTEELLDQLKSPEDWTRHFAKRVLKERGASVLPILAAKLSDVPINPANEPWLLEALWTYQALNPPASRKRERPEELLVTLLQAQEPRIRSAAVRVLSHWHSRIPNALDLLSQRVADDHPQVRLEAVRALGLISGTRSVELALSAMDRPMDRFLEYGLYLTLIERRDDWLPAFQEGKLLLGGDSRKIAFALKAIGSEAGARQLGDLLTGGKVPPEQEPGILAVLADLGGPRELALVLQRGILDTKLPPVRRAELLETLARATKQRNAKPEKALDAILSLLQEGPLPLRLAAIHAAGAWRLQLARESLIKIADHAQTDINLRRASIEALALLGPENESALSKLAQDGLPAVRRFALIALVGLNAKSAANHAAAVLHLPGDADEIASVFDAFLGQKGAAELLTTALIDRKLPADVARVGVRTARSTGRNQPGLIDSLTKAGSLTFGPRILSADEMRQTVSDVAKLGDPARGEKVYRRKDFNCQKCHALGGAGGQVGPDLTSVGASAQVDYLVESLLQPNKAVKENYHALLVSTKTGKLFTGIKARQTDTELILRTAEDVEIAIPRKDIDETIQGASLMPDGLTDTLTRGEFLDLVRFLSELGKVGPYAPTKARLVRRWLTDDGMTGSAAGQTTAIYSTTGGFLPIQDLPRKPKLTVSFELEVTTPGPVLLKWNSIMGLEVRLNDSPLPPKETMTVNLPLGRQLIRVMIDTNEYRADLRCELDDVANSLARVRVVGGK